jgi:hypothetical protein
LSCLLAVGLALRFAFAWRSPLLVTGDSETYLGPALDLVQGAGFDLSLKRTPGYPLMLAAVLTITGQDLRGLATVQHGLGLATAALAYLLARQLAGPMAGLLAGLATALAGNLLLYERLVMTETLFTTLLSAAVLALVAAARRPSLRWLLMAGLAIGVATLVRPVAQLLLLLPPLALLLAGRLWPDVLRGSLITLLGYSLLVGPWMVRGAFSSDGASVGALGQTLVGRTARHDRRDAATDSGFVFYDPASDADDPDPTRLAGRSILQEAANRGSSGRAVHTRLRRELGLSEVDADRLMRDLALEAIARRPGYYVAGTGQRFVRLWATPPERLGRTWSDQDTIRRGWEHSGSALLLSQTGQSSPQDLAYGETISALQPAYLGPGLAVLFLLGLAAAIANPRYRLALVPAAAVLSLVALSAALVGGVARYRYPEDPLVFVVIAVGLTWAASKVRRVRSPSAS